MYMYVISVITYTLYLRQIISVTPARRAKKLNPLENIHFYFFPYRVRNFLNVEKNNFPALYFSVCLSVWIKKPSIAQKRKVI